MIIVQDIVRERNFTIESEKISFVGDVIFQGSVGRADLPGGDFSLLENSIRDKVYVLDEATILYPGMVLLLRWEKSAVVIPLLGPR